MDLPTKDQNKRIYMLDGLSRSRDDRARISVIQQAVAYVFDIPVDEISAPTRRSARASMARQVAMYLAHVGLEMSLSRVGLAFGRDRTTAAYACHRVEDRRDDPEFDAKLDELETCIRSMPEPVNAQSQPELAA